LGIDIRPEALRGRREAIIVGIDKYEEDPAIPALNGAVNDAKEMYERLSNPKIGGFNIPDEHLLIGEKATYKAIRKAISEVFFQPKAPDLSLFYFSGHGDADGYGNGFILPWNTIKAHPFACGINMKELHTVASKPQGKNASVIMIFDCCYSGIAADARGDRRAEFDDQVKNLSGEGVVVLTSSGANEVSKEVDYLHGDGLAYKHGAYTSCLLEVLDGKAGGVAGIVSPNDLIKYAEDHITEKNKGQQARHYDAGFKLDDINIAIVPACYFKNIEKILESIKLGSESEIILDKIDAAIEMYDFIKQNQENEKAKLLEINLRNSLCDLKSCAVLFLSDLQGDDDWKPLRKYNKNLEDIVDKLDFDKINLVKPHEKSLLEQLCRVSMKNLSAQQRLTKSRFIYFCKERFTKLNMDTTARAAS
jgi:hypothetical protein